MKISYEIKSQVKSHWKTNQSPFPDSDLLGLQFEFKDEPGGTHLKSLVVFQIYLEKSTLKLFKVIAGKPIVKSNHQVFEIDANTPDGLDQIPHTQIDSTSMLYMNLEFYSEKTDFVFFGIDDIRYMDRHFDYIFLSGSLLDCGLRIGDYASNTYHSQEPIFSLKIEGTKLKPGGNSNVKLPETLTAGIAIGAPCPPTWYAFNILLRQVPVYIQKSPDKVKILEQNWMSITRL